MLKRKDSILISAIDLLYAEGINGLTTKKLAKLQGVSEPALYRQYKSKLDIVIHIIDEFSNYDSRIMNTIKESSMKGKEAILFYVKRFSELYQNYSELTTIMYSMDAYQYNEKTRNMIKQIHQTKTNFLQEVIKEGQDLKDINNLFSAEELAKIINGLVFSLTYDWRINNKEQSLEEILINVIGKLL